MLLRLRFCQSSSRPIRITSLRQGYGSAGQEERFPITSLLHSLNPSILEETSRHHSAFVSFLTNNAEVRTIAATSALYSSPILDPAGVHDWVAMQRLHRREATTVNKEFSI